MRILALILIWLMIGVVSGQEQTPITPDNADQVVELHRIGNGYTPTVTISPNEDIIAITSSIGVWIYDVHDLSAEPRFLPAIRGRSSAIFSPDGSRLVGGLSDMSLRVWDVATGAVEMDLYGNRDFIAEVKFSPDGRLILSVGLDNARIWDAETGELIHFLSAGGTYAGNFSRDGQRVLTAGIDGVGYVWDVATGELLLSLVGHRDTIATAIFSPDERVILTASSDGDVRLWDAETGLLQHVLIGSQYINQAFYNQSGDTIVSVASDKVWVWDAETALPRFALSGHSSARGAIFNHDETQLITTDWENNIYRWDMRTGELIEAFEAQDKGIVIDGSNDFEIGQVYTVTDETINIWNINTDTIISLDNRYHYITNQIAYNPEKEWAVTFGRQADQAVFWDSQTWEILDIFALSGSWGRQAFFSRDNERLIITSQYGVILVLDIASHSLLHSSQPYHTPEFKMSVDGVHLFADDPAYDVLVWNTETGEEHPNPEQFIKAEHDYIEQEADSKRLTAYHDEDRNVWIHNRETDRTYPIEDGRLGWDNFFFTEDQSLFVMITSAWYFSHGAVHIWDAETGRYLNGLEGHTQEIRDVIFSADGSRIFTSSNDGTIRIWGIPPQ